MQRGRSKKEYKVSGSRNLHSGRSWSIPEEMKTWSAALKFCEKSYLARRHSRWDDFEKEFIEKKKEIEGVGLGNNTRGLREGGPRRSWAFEHCAGDLRKSKDFLRRIIAPVGGLGGVALSYICPQCNSFPLEDFFWWVSTGKKQCSCNLERDMNGEHPTGFW